ncbi:putative phytosulfokines 6 [Bidens hawaiensis]|uniref:putative phytosulfokines 6 n=1 Tax=Bidens hawaiensis TaxID=980011 RepID=UPI00404AB567
MKHSFRCSVPFIFLLSLIAFSHTSARFLHTKPDEHMVKLDESINTSLLDFNEVMGLEECENNGDEDEECLKRRVLADAHLDYIYTQHHKP